MKGLAMNEFAEFLSKMASEKENDSPKIKNTPEALKSAFDSLQTKHTFSQGDLVQWKTNLANKKSPKEGEPCIVTEVLAEPIFDPVNETGNQYFKERLDMKIGIFKGNTFYEFHVDSRRFEPYKPE